MKTLLYILAFPILATVLHADEINIAVAADFAPTAAKIIEIFEKETDHKIHIVTASTTKLSAQIQNGSPMSAFLAADKEHPKMLEEKGIAIKHSRFTYAIGHIYLWSQNPTLIDKQGDVLNKGDFKHLAIANPIFAPYGKAAQEALTNLHVWEKLQGKLVIGESVAQAFQFVKSGNAQLGIIASSYLVEPGKKIPGSFWVIPQDDYNPLVQQAVLLEKNPVAEEFLKFLKSSQAQLIIEGHGYSTPK